MTLKGLIYYLKVPKDKAGQQKRFRQVIGQKSSYMQKYQSTMFIKFRTKVEIKGVIHIKFAHQEEEHRGPSSKIIVECRTREAGIKIEISCKV